MAHEEIKLGSLCSIMTGIPIGRAKKANKNEDAMDVKVLVPRAMENQTIDDEKIVVRAVSHVKSDFFTCTGDIIVKATTPYDCVYVDESHSGLLITSFAMLLRPLSDADIDMRYLSAFLNLPQVKENIRRVSQGTAIALINKNTLADIKVPVPSKAIQEQIAFLFESTQTRKQCCRKIIEASDLLLESEFARSVLS